MPSDRPRSRPRRVAQGPADARAALAFVKKRGIVLMSARGPVPSLAKAIAGEPIRGSWWAHPKSREIFRAVRAVSQSPNVLVCKLINDKVTYVHRRVWPVLIKLAPRFDKKRLAKVWDEHTKSGAHVSRRIPFPRWVPEDVMKEAGALSIQEAERVLAAVLPWKPFNTGRKRRTPRHS